MNSVGSIDGNSYELYPKLFTGGYVGGFWGTIMVAFSGGY